MYSTYTRCLKYLVPISSPLADTPFSNVHVISEIVCVCHTVAYKALLHATYSSMSFALFPICFTHAKSFVMPQYLLLHAHLFAHGITLTKEIAKPLL